VATRLLAQPNRPTLHWQDWPLGHIFLPFTPKVSSRENLEAPVNIKCRGTVGLVSNVV
jgi:hypothetical protein